MAQFEEKNGNWLSCSEMKPLETGRIWSQEFKQHLDTPLEEVVHTTIEYVMGMAGLY